jgi:hypothetical protein
MFALIYFIVYPNYLINTRPERPKYDNNPNYKPLHWTFVFLMYVLHPSLSSNLDAQNNYRMLMDVKCFERHPP